MNDAQNEFLAKIGSPFRIGQSYPSNGKTVVAKEVVSGVHPRVVFSDGWDRSALNGRVRSTGPNVLDIDLTDEQKTLVREVKVKKARAK